MVGLGVWCAAGTLSVATPDDPSVRVAMPAAWEWLAGATVLASLVPGWRRQPVLAMPALLATLPWWPVPVPAAALIWTGPMAWLPILLAFVAALPWGRTGNREGRRLAAAGPGLSALLAATMTLGAVGLTAWSLDPRIPGGDEPHYLVITQSLLADGDLRIENNHASRDYAAYYAGGLRPHFLRRGTNGAVYSVHAPGAPMLVLPAFAVAGYRGAQATIMLLGALTGGLIWLAAWLASGDKAAAWTAWLAVVATPTFLVQSVTIFPDGPGAFVTAAAAVLALSLSRPAFAGRWRMPAVVGGSALLSALPWLHTRFAVLAGGFGAVVVWRLVSADVRSAIDRRRALAAFIAIPAASAVAWFSYFLVIYGTLNPAAPYGDNPNTRLAHIPGGLSGLLFDAQFGLLAYSPILAAGFACAVMRRSGSDRRLILALMGVAVGYLATAATYWMWWAGVPASPARFAAAAIPVFAAPVAVAWQQSGPALRALWRTLLAVSVATTAVVLGVGRGSLAWNVRGVRSAWLDWLSGVADLSRGWPSFFWRLVPGDLTSHWHFAAHAALWVGVICGSAVVLVVWRQRAASRRANDAVVAVCWVALALMTAVAAGWRLTGSSGLSAAPSQGQVLARVASGDRAFRISAMRVGPWPDVSEAFRIRATRVDLVGEPGAGWLPLFDVPPGRYDVTVSSRRPRAGALSFRIGRSPRPTATMPVAAVSRQTRTLDLPAGAAALLIEPDAGFAAVGESVVLAPRRLDQASDRALSSARYGDVDVFFFDNNAVFVEDDGFWIRGGRTAPFMLAVSAGQPTVTVSIGNGATPNDVTVEHPEAIETHALASFEGRDLRLPAPDDGRIRLRVTSSSGFRPSDVGPGADARYLGARIIVSSSN